MTQHARWMVLAVLVALAGCGKSEIDEKREAAKPQSQAEPQSQAQPEQLPKQSEDGPRTVPATTTAASGKPPRLEPDPKSDRAARGEVATATSPEQSATPAGQPAPQPAQPVAQSSAPTSATPQTSAPAQAESAKPTSAQKQQPTPTKPIVLKDGALGAITFVHATHKMDCATCHHPSREAKPLAQPQQACTSCHTKPPQAGMKTTRQAAFHDPRGQSGTCIDCHKKSGGKAPVKCADCHKKA